MAYATKYYTPRLDRALVARLYHEAKAQRVPMTVLTNRLVESALSRLDTVGSSTTCVVAEEPPGRDPAPVE